MTKSDSIEPEEFSVIKFFRYFSEYIETLGDAPLGKDALTINKDVYEQLGGDEIDEELPFAHVAFDFPTSNNDLMFTLDLYASGAAMGIGSFEYTFCHYEHIGKDEQQVAARMVDILKALCNEQLALLCTYTEDDENLQAIEVLYRKPGAAKYDAIATYPMFESKRKLKGRELKTERFANFGSSGEVSVQTDAFLYFIPESPSSHTYDRKQISGLHVPLSREVWERKIDDYYDKKSDELVARFDGWANKENLTFMEQVVKYGRWRHVELASWSLVLLAYEYVVGWRLWDLPLQYVALAGITLGLVVYRNKVSYGRYLSTSVLFAYGLALLAAFMFVTLPEKSLWWWIVGVCWTFSVVECIGLDIRGLMQMLRPRAKRGRARSKRSSRE